MLSPLIASSQKATTALRWERLNLSHSSQPSDLKHIAGTLCNVMLPEEWGYSPTGNKALQNARL